MDDLISRQEAIDYVDDVPYIKMHPNIGLLWKAWIEQLSPAKPERKKGKWIDYTDDGYVECPFCHSATNCDGNKDELHYCFSCGSDMRGEQDDESRSNSNAQTDTRARGMGATDKSSGI